MKIDLRDTLVKAYGGDNKSEQNLVTYCARIAEAYLITKSSKHDHLIQFSSSSYSDFALDAIAELFKREAGELVLIRKWYERVDGVQLNDSDLFMEFRRLIFSSVNDHIFGMYRKMDSSLSKIIRNLKRGISENDIEGLSIDQSDQSIYLTGIEFPSKRLNLEILEIKLSYRLPKTNNIVELLQVVRDILEEHKRENPFRISITALATIIRKQYATLNEIENEIQLNQTDIFSENEWREFIFKSVQSVKLGFYKSYVVSNKLTDEQFNAYFYITQEILQNEYLNGRASNLSFFEQTQKVYPELSKEMYRDNHRVILEYFVKKSRGELKRLVSKEISSAN